MRTIYILLIFTMISCSSSKTIADHSNISFHKYDGWIFSNATPTGLSDVELEIVDNLLKKCIEQYNNGTINKINLKKYKRQYVAVVNQFNEREVWINCLCNIEGHDWKTQLVEVSDGGKCYFNLKVNLSKMKYYDFRVNGEA